MPLKLGLNTDHGAALIALEQFTQLQHPRRAHLDHGSAKAGKTEVEFFKHKIHRKFDYIMKTMKISVFKEFLSPFCSNYESGL